VLFLNLALIYKYRKGEVELKKYDNKISKKKIFTKRGISNLLVIFIFFLGVNYIFGQKGFYADEKRMIQKFKIADKFFQKGKSYFIKRKFKKAEKELNKCLEIMSQHSEACFYLSNIFYDRKELKQALRYIEEAKKNFEFMIKMHVSAFDDYLKQLREQKKGLEEKLIDYRGRLARTQDSGQRQELNNAINSIEGNIRLINSKLSDPLPPVAKIPSGYYYLHGNIFFKMKNFKEAYSQYIETIKLNPKLGNAYNNLAIIHYMSKQYQKALEYLNKAEANGAEVNPKFKEAILKNLKK
jgi:tetratricopeptide (TPR) repeat protein